jgi:hypothetical protein
MLLQKPRLGKQLRAEAIYKGLQSHTYVYKGLQSRNCDHICLQGFAKSPASSSYCRQALLEVNWKLVIENLCRLARGMPNQAGGFGDLWSRLGEGRLPDAPNYRV